MKGEADIPSRRRACSELRLVGYASGARRDGIPAQLVTHHVQARTWGHPGAKARRRRLRLIVSWEPYSDVLVQGLALRPAVVTGDPVDSY
jgi:hypothetical protein